jgi:hypothetical protein
MRKMLAATAGTLLLALPAACAAPTSDAQRGQQAAQAFNQDARLGRAEAALERVDPALREAFTEHHKAWGNDIRIADLELAGLKAHGAHDLDILVRFAWYRETEQELRTTTVKQVWRDKDGWLLIGEERLEGDVGLLGDAVPPPAPVEPHAPARFQTVRIGSAGSGE